MPNLNLMMMYRSGLYTNEQLDSLDTFLAIVTFISVPVGLAFLWLCYNDAELYKLSVVFWFLSLSFVSSIISLLVSSINWNKEVPPAFCKNNAEGIDSSDGATLCLVETVGIFSYIIPALRWAWFVMAFDLYLKIVLRIRETKGLRPVYGFIVFVFPIAHVIDVLSTNSYGYKIYGIPFCYIVSESNLNYSRYVIDYPSIGILALGFPFAMSSCIHLIKIIYFEKPIPVSTDKHVNRKKRRNRRKQGIQAGEFSRPPRPSYLQQGLPGPHHLEFSSSIDPTSESASYAFAAKGKSVVSSFGADSSKAETSDGSASSGPMKFQEICRHLGYEESTLIGTLVLLLLSFVAFLNYIILNLSRDDTKMIDSYEDWSKCIFLNVADSSVCGEHPKIQPGTLGSSKASIFFHFGMNIISAISFLIHPAMWRRIYANHLKPLYEMIACERSSFPTTPQVDSPAKARATGKDKETMVICPPDLPMVIKREIYLPTANPSEIEFGTRRQSFELNTAGTNMSMSMSMQVPLARRDDLEMIEEVEDLDI
jgi:hypothetical protein